MSRRPIMSASAYLAETLLVLLCVSGLAALLLVLAKRVGVGRPAGPIRLLGQLPFGPRRAVYLVRVGERVYVLGAAEGGFTKLGELAASDLGSTPERDTSFRALVERLGPKPRQGGEP